jgi:FixJ family two-component response regulator
VAYLVDPDGLESSNTNLLENISRRKREIIQVLYEGIRNPVVASALHNHCFSYLTVITFIINAMEKPEDREHRRDLFQSIE